MTPPPEILKADPFYLRLRAHLDTHARISVTPEPEDDGGPVPDGPEEGLDTETCDAINARLEDGDEWAWCSVKVTATFGWGLVSASRYLGQCSYADEAGFRADAYFEDMRAEALDDLALDLYAITVEIERIL